MFVKLDVAMFSTSSLISYDYNVLLLYSLGILVYDALIDLRFDVLTFAFMGICSVMRLLLEFSGFWASIDWLTLLVL